MTRRLIAAAVAVTAIAGTLTRAEESKDWRRVESANFVGIGNASEGDLRDTVGQLEAFRTALGRLFPPFAPKRGGVGTLILFKDRAAFAEFAPRDGRGKRQENIAGYFTTGARGDLFVLGNWQGDTGLQIVYHEYVHRVIHRNIGSIPDWVDEGLADLYSTFDIDAKRGTVTIGVPPEWRRQSLRSESWIPLRDVVDPDASVRLRIKQPERVSMWYAESWALVHFLAFSSKGSRAPQLTTFLNAVRGGMATETAFTEAFGGTYAKVESDLRAYLSVGIPAMRVSLGDLASGAAAPSVRRMTRAEAEAAQGCLLSDSGALEDAEKHLTAALADDPAHVEARACLGSVRIRQGRGADGLAVLEPLAAEAPASVQAQYSLGQALSRADREEDAVRAFSRATDLAPDFAGAWFELSSSTLVLRRDAQSNAALQQALRLDSNPEWIRTRAHQALGVDRPDVASSDARRFIAQHGVGDDSGVYTAFVGAIADRRQGRDAEAAALLADAAVAVDPKRWTARVLAFLQGQLDAKAFLDAAHDNGERTEAHTYIGFADLQAGRVDDAKTHFQWVRDKGSRNYIEYGLAVSELTRLERVKR